MKVIKVKQNNANDRQSNNRYKFIIEVVENSILTLEQEEKIIKFFETL